MKQMDERIDPQLAYIQGPTAPPVWELTLGQVIDIQAKQYGSKTAAIFPWQRHALSYADFALRSKIVSKGLVDAGLKHGDCVGIMAGNCYQYLELFLGAARIGCPFVVLNNTYTPLELRNALIQSGMAYGDDTLLWHG